MPWSSLQILSTTTSILGCIGGTIDYTQYFIGKIYSLLNVGIERFGET